MVDRYAIIGCVCGLCACVGVGGAGCSALLLSEKAAPTPVTRDDTAKPQNEVVRSADAAEIQRVAHWVEETAAETSTPNLPEASGEENLRAASQEAAVLTVDELLDYALHHHPQLRARKSEIGAAAGRVTQARLLPNPNFVIDSESPLTENDPTTITSRLMFTIPLTHKRLWRQGVECAGIQRARAQLDEETELILTEVADAALEVAYYQQLVAEQSELSQLANRAAAAHRGRVGATFADATAAATTAADSELAYRDVVERLQGARDRLARAVAWQPGQAIMVSGRLNFSRYEGLPLTDVLALAQKRHPRIAAAQALVSQSRQAYNLARAEAWPDLNFGPRFQADTDGPDDRLGGRLAVDVPIFNRNQGSIAETAAKLRASRDWLTAAQLGTLNDVAAAYHSVVALQQTLLYYDEKIAPDIEQTQTTLEGVEKQQGIEAHQALDVRQRLLKMKIEHLDRLYRYSRLLARLELLVGQPLTASPVVL